ncbi:MAG: hypothetical protein PHV74_07950 [Dehalococcoidia bacterium]|nr:hypothetical protein [Dehalococcoidia bacterium]
MKDFNGVHSQIRVNARFCWPVFLIYAGTVLVIVACTLGCDAISDILSQNDNEYRGYYFGLVKFDDGISVGNGCYDDVGGLIVLINNQAAKNPTYAELLEFLRDDKTDAFPYTDVPEAEALYYRSPEDSVALDSIKAIIDRKATPKPPKICADFAERLHNNAEIAGIRCGYISLCMNSNSNPEGSGMSCKLGHACNVFETTDKGLIVIDDTGSVDSDGPPNGDMVIDVLEVGKQYRPRFLFPDGEWSVSAGATVTDISVTWDGAWNSSWLR